MKSIKPKPPQKGATAKKGNTGAKPAQPKKPKLK